MELRLRIEDHPAVLAWRELGGHSSVPAEIEPVARWYTRPKKNPREVYRLRGVDGVTTPVIAKRCKPDEAARELAVYREILPHVPIPHPQLYGAVETSQGEQTWLFLEDIQGEPYRPELPEHRRLAGRSLGILHTAARQSTSTSGLRAFEYRYDAGPNRIGDYLDTSRGLLAEVRSNPALGRGDLEVLAAIARQCELVRAHWAEIEEFSETVPRTLVHGDLLIPNLRVRDGADGKSLFLFDWGRSGWAIPAFDLTRFLGSALAPDLGSYLAEVRRFHPALDVQGVRRLAYLGELFRWLDAVRWELEGLRSEWIEKAMSRLNLYRHWMEDIRRAAPWRDNPALAHGERRSYLPSDT